ncbi:MAG: hypothetical protein A3H17_03560 [Candidatus Levybacteria bacterium RIFCSPLOWO2_12_FULL_37_14]|nr:MAG: hypothetical protein US43_C0022G0002 [Candidatus Levybacteria bacterium GW2011_GWA1_37_16]KKQ40755.1 MAG: hypothetical protein US59_C0048G0002 [Candidatus Levybacteria bacterium GW2011_GWB1_37_8]OGH49818.1 MAG: hypothetical protein A3H17_03560 [Candidatus Levybacteria bacterium RIFCSPLOWO2_12_FULL_37_14]
MVWISRLYVFFLGIILCVTTGFGIAAFYPEPVRPDFPSTPAMLAPVECSKTLDAQTSGDCQAAFQKQDAAQRKFDEEMKVFNNKNAGYTRTAIFFGIAVGSIFAVLGLGLIKKGQLVAKGLLLASVLTAILTRFLIGLASLGASVTGTQGADAVAYVEFGVLFVLSIAIIFVGLSTLKETNS